MSQFGRPRTLDEMKRREICALVSAGEGLAQAACYVGCSVKTIRREAERNDDFAEGLRRAELSARLAPLQAMRKAAQTHWRAAAWMLERTNPERFGRKSPKSFGRKELRALARDLEAIVNEEVIDPLLSERLSRRFKATINYAMRHAWDDKRTGPQLRRAMKYFDVKQAAAEGLPVSPAPPNELRGAWPDDADFPATEGSEPMPERDVAVAEFEGEANPTPDRRPSRSPQTDSVDDREDRRDDDDGQQDSGEGTDEVKRALWSCWTKVREMHQREGEETSCFPGSAKSRRDYAPDFCPEKCDFGNGTKVAGSRQMAVGRERIDE